MLIGTFLGGAMRLVILAAVLVLGFGASAPRAQQLEANIVTGGPAGTYIQIGRDLAGVGAECGFTLNARESAGSIENFLAVRDRPVTQLGIVQSDVLEYFQTFQADNAELMRAVEGIRIAFPLYNEEVHVLARRDIAGLADLAGRRVAIGVADSGTFVTAQLMLDLTEVEPAERLELGPSESLEALLAGEIDAFFYVVGAPAELFASERIDPEAFHLLPLTDPVLRAVYTPTEIAAGTYPVAPEPVELVAVKAILVTFDYDPRLNAYHRASCDNVADVSHLIVSRIETLRESGHPKWRGVDMTELPPGWEVSACVLAGVSPAYPFTCQRPDGTVVEEGAAATATEPNRLYLERICSQIEC